MHAIQTKYLGPTNTLGGRISATCGGARFVVGYRHDLSERENHIRAAYLVSPDKFASAHLRGCVWVHIPEDES